MTALEQLKILLDKADDSEDKKLSLLLARATDTVLDYIGRNELPDRLISVVVDLAVIAYNKQGAEGEASRSEGGISRSFDTLPEDIKRRLSGYPRKVGVYRAADE